MKHNPIIHGSVGLTVLIPLLLGVVAFTGCDDTLPGARNNADRPVSVVENRFDDSTLQDAWRQPEEGFPSKDEARAVAQWIERNKLNSFGDPENTVYAGGSPLFLEAGPTPLSRYQYLIQQHPGRPWKKSTH
ncbi:MAG: hypothetical protein SFZ03_07105 [Candidatus Melainabacteria bacterium]|nr:hypothetical protein [Candidatus Melainabacteria bacterium]